MAEVLAVVASGIAVAQLADRIVQSIRKIHDFWKSIQDAPQELNDALEELEILGETLMELHTLLSKRDKPELPGNAAAKCLSYSKRVADNLETILVSLRQGLDGKRGPRRWAAMKVAFQRRTLQEFQQRLDRAKSMLNLAINCYSLYVTF
jgi:predicted trehalose synthase